MNTDMKFSMMFNSRKMYENAAMSEPYKPKFVLKTAGDDRGLFYSFSGFAADLVCQQIEGANRGYPSMFLKLRKSRQFKNGVLMPITADAIETYRHLANSKSGLVLNRFNIDCGTEMDYLAELCPSIDDYGENSNWKRAQKLAESKDERNKNMFGGGLKFSDLFVSLPNTVPTIKFQLPERTNADKIIRNTINRSQEWANITMGYVIFDGGYGTLVPFVSETQESSNDNSSILKKRMIYFYYANGLSSKPVILRDEDIERIANNTHEDYIHFSGSRACLNVRSGGTSEKDFTDEEKFAYWKIMSDFGYNVKYPGQHESDYELSGQIGGRIEGGSLGGTPQDFQRYSQRVGPDELAKIVHGVIDRPGAPLDPKGIIELLGKEARKQMEKDAHSHGEILP
jgi:hypothetical protein